MITFPYSSPLHLLVILIHIIQPTIHKALHTTRKVKNGYNIWEQSIIILLCISGWQKLCLKSSHLTSFQRLNFKISAGDIHIVFFF